MASTKTLSARNLEALGATRLAKLLIELSTGDAAAKRRLRLELAGTAGADEAAREIGKRLASIAKARTFIDWRKAKSFIADLEAQHRAIIDHVAPSDPRNALDLLWRLLHCAGPVLARTSDGGGRILAVFASAARDLAPLALAAKVTPIALANSVFDAVRHDADRNLDDLIGILADALGTVGLEHLRALGQAWSAEASAAGPAASWSMIRHKAAATTFLAKLSDALDDVDGFIALFDAKARAVPAIAARIAERLLKAGRPDEAWSILKSARPGSPPDQTAEYEQALLATLEALGRTDEAQARRWTLFAAPLDVGHLRTYLRKLPEFEDFDAEERAMIHALAFPDGERALGFLIEWPALDRAARLVIERSEAIKGDAFEILAPAADALEAKHPLAATIVRRAMIDFALGHGRSARYKHVARHFDECARLAARIDAYHGQPDHAAYAARLRSLYARKAAFWEELAAL